MKKRLLITGLVLAALTLAVAAWTVDGLTWAARTALPRAA
jgi:hypothetical protein